MCCAVRHMAGEAQTIKLGLGVVTQPDIIQSHVAKPILQLRLKALKIASEEETCFLLSPRVKSPTHQTGAGEK